MCGIAGFLDEPGKIIENKLSKAIACLKDRGPDHDNFWVNEDNSIGLVHTRLAIIDLHTRSNQPFKYLNRYRIVFNGEIYNYKQLRSEIKEKYGLFFSTDSDTEVILAYYHIHKAQCLQYFNGMFSFAIYDNIEQTLFCARDRFGEKPFFYFKNENQFYFASRPSSIHAYGVPRLINRKILLHYLGAGQISIASQKTASFFENIDILPPAHFLTLDIKRNHLKVEPYWNIDTIQERHTSNKSQDEEFFCLFKSSVLERLHSDVRLGASISGGLDSSSIAYIISKVNHQSLTGFSAVFPGFDKDESPYINMISDSLNLDIHKVNPRIADLEAHFLKMVRAHDHPIADPSSFAQYMVFLTAKQHGYSVMIDGQGADEILAGYSKYNHWAIQELVAKGRLADARKLYNDLKINAQEVKGGLLNFILPIIPNATNYQLIYRYASQIKNNRWLTKGFIDAYFNLHDIKKPIVRSLRDIQHFDITCLGLQDLLRYADSNSMAHGVEVRLPFLDHKLVEYALNLPIEEKINKGFNKYVLRKAMERKLPDAITWRKRKIGYEVPSQEWVKDKFLQDIIEDSWKKLSNEKIVGKTKPMHDTLAQWRIAVAGQLI